MAYVSPDASDPGVFSGPQDGHGRSSWRVNLSELLPTADRRTEDGL